MWGLNVAGMLGKEYTNFTYNKPIVNIFFMNEIIVAMSSGAHHSIGLTEAGEVFVAGCNGFGQVGNESEELLQLTPIKVKAVNNEKFIKISCGYYHLMALTDCGHVYSWGRNNCGQLGVVDTNGSHNMFKTRKFQENKPKSIKRRISFI
jgi:alpha-tubulin suppressor-like RCC1 family protein